jgi:hypothetical protein
MSGLDPLGRSLVRDVILDLKRQGTTVLFSSHVLPDVETLCDRVTVVAGGTVVLEGAVADLVSDADPEFEIVVAEASPRMRSSLTARGVGMTASGSRILIAAPDRAAMNGLVAELIADGAEIAAVTPRRSPLEQRFLAAVRGAVGTSGMHDGGPDDVRPTNTAASTAGTHAAITARSTPGSNAGSTPGSNAGSTPGSNAGSTAGTPAATTPRTPAATPTTRTGTDR